MSANICKNFLRSELYDNLDATNFIFLIPDFKSFNTSLGFNSGNEFSAIYSASTSIITCLRNNLPYEGFRIIFAVSGNFFIKFLKISPVLKNSCSYFDFSSHVTYPGSNNPLRPALPDICKNSFLEIGL